MDIAPSQLTPWKPRPVLGAQNALILQVEFPDVRFASSTSRISSLLETVDQWFRTSSYGKMYINFTIYEDVLTLPRTMASYGAPEPGASRGDNPARLDGYVSDTLGIVLSETSIDLMGFKHIVIIHSGEDEAAAAGNPNAIWSFCACEGPYADENPDAASWKLVDDTGAVVHTFWGVSTFSEDEPWSILAHELSHSLGLSDLYVYGSDGYSEGSGVGFWSMMDAGAVLDPPSDIDGWSKYILGWIEPVMIDRLEGDYTIYALDSANDPKALLIPIDARGTEYYYVHARRIAGTDGGLPSEGVVVFRIDVTRERSYRGQELALISDANPGTPNECSAFRGAMWEDCRTLDAPYNEKGRQYAFSYVMLSVEIVLNNDVFWDPDNKIGFKTQPVGDGAFSIRLGLSPGEIPAGTTTTTTTEAETTLPPAQCAVATAAYGSELASEVKYMRHVRDDLVGSSRTGAVLVASWNAFYYSWSPTVAGLVAGDWLLRWIFRIFLLPLMAIVHVTALVFWASLKLTGVSDLASLAAFLAAAFSSITVYVASPLLLAATVLNKAFLRRRLSDS